MPPSGHTKSEPLSNRVKVQFTDAQLQTVTQHADAVGQTVACFVRSTVLMTLDEAAGKEVRRKKPHTHATQLQIAALHDLAMQIKKLGTNVNQIAKQANTGMVPITRGELQYVLNNHQLAFSQIVAAMEKLLA